MGTSKILIDGVGIDLTQDTVVASKMLSGTKAHDSNGDSITGAITSKAAATYTPTTTDQTIAAGQFLSGAQTVKGDANLAAGNIKQGVSIFGVAGSLTPGITPSGTKSITANGTYDVTQFASASVNVQPSNYRRFTGVISTIRTGSVAEVTLIDDDIIGQLSDNIKLLIRLTTDAPLNIAYTLLGVVAVNDNTLISTPASSSYYQTCQRIGGTAGQRNDAVCNTGLTNTAASLRVGQLLIRGNTLNWIVHSTNYAVRPCNYVVEVLW